jgi:hypothetical protein
LEQDIIRALCSKNKKPESRPLVGLNSELIFKHALAVFVMRPQADIKSAQLRKNNQLAQRRQMRPFHSQCKVGYVIIACPSFNGMWPRPHLIIPDNPEKFTDDGLLPAATRGVINV